MKILLITLFNSFSLITYSQITENSMSKSDSSKYNLIIGKWCYTASEDNYMKLENINTRNSLLSDCSGLIFYKNNLVEEVVASNRLVFFSKRVTRYVIENSILTLSYSLKNGQLENENYEIILIEKNKIILKHQ